MNKTVVRAVVAMMVLWAFAAGAALIIAAERLNSMGEPNPHLTDVTTLVAGLLLLIPFGTSTLRILRRGRAT